MLLDYLDTLAHLVLKELQVYLVQQEIKELKVQLAHKATEDPMEQQESVEKKVALEVLDSQDHKDYQVTVGCKVIRVLLVHQVLLGILDLKVHQVLKGLQGSRELREMWEFKVLLALQVHLDRLDNLVIRVFLVHLVLQEIKGYQDILAR